MTKVRFQSEQEAQEYARTLIDSGCQAKSMKIHDQAVSMVNLYGDTIKYERYFELEVSCGKCPLVQICKV